jgi:hypothetical protein
MTQLKPGAKQLDSIDGSSPEGKRHGGRNLKQ